MSTTKTNRLYRSRTDSVIGGVSGGLGDYLVIDPVIVRIIFVLLAIFGGSGVLVYIILWIVIPEAPIGYHTFKNEDVKVEPDDIADTSEKKRKTNTSLVAGVVLIAFGLIFLIDQLVPFYRVIDFWPLLLVLAGVMLIRPEILKTSNKNIES